MWPNQAGKLSHFLVLLCFCFKRNLSAKPSYESEFCMQFHFHPNQSHFHKNGVTLRLALRQRHSGTWKWSICTHSQEICLGPGC